MADLISPWKPEPDVLIHQALGKACEEASELANILARCLIQGISSSEPVTGKPNRQALFEEIADLDAAVQWLRELLDDGYDQYDGARADRKLAGFHRWQRLLEADMAPQPRQSNLSPVAWRWRWQDSASWVLTDQEPAQHDFRVIEPLSGPTPAPVPHVCATEGCEEPATERFEAGGVGSIYCAACVAKVAAITSASVSNLGGSAEHFGVATALYELLMMAKNDGVASVTDPAWVQKDFTATEVYKSLFKALTAPAPVPHLEGDADA